MNHQITSNCNGIRGIGPHVRAQQWVRSTAVAGEGSSAGVWLVQSKQEARGGVNAGLVVKTTSWSLTGHGRMTSHPRPGIDIPLPSLGGDLSDTNMITWWCLLEIRYDYITILDQYYGLLGRTESALTRIRGQLRAPYQLNSKFDVLFSEIRSSPFIYL